MNIYRWATELRKYSPNTELAFLIIRFAPYLSIPVAIFNCAGLFFYNPFQNNKVSQFTISSSPFICFRVVTKGDIPGFVIQTVISNKDLCLRFGLQRFIFQIVSDSPIECTQNNKIQEIIVPESYQTRNGSLYKARALNYCLESHVNSLTKNTWIVHLDEETLLTEESLSGILHFVTNGDADIGQGPISYANGKNINNWITTLADSFRSAIDYSLFRFQFAFLNRPVFGFKGSYIVVRNSVEMDVGLDNGPDGSIAEDCFFALNAWSKGYKFGFITGEMHEISPFTLKDFICQRRRWFVGQMYIILYNGIPFVYKLGISLTLICSILMPISFSNVIIDTFYPFQIPLTLCCLNGFVGGTFSFLYCFGTFISCERRNWSGIRLIIVCVFSCLIVVPIAIVMESIAVYLGLFTLRSNVFHVVQKDCNKRNVKKSDIKIV